MLAVEDNLLKIKIDGNVVELEKFTWSEMEYDLDEKGGIVSKVKCSFVQFPVTLAYALTIHKSQGKSFSRVTVDIGAGAFAPGQIYVALSRSRSLEGLVLNRSINDQDIFVDPRVVDFYKTQSIPPSTYQPEQEQQPEEVSLVIAQAIDLIQQVKIQYEKNSGERSTRLLSEIRYSDEYGDSTDPSHIKAYCHERKAERTFKLVRIRSVEVMK